MAMKSVRVLAVLAVLAMAISFVYASDPGQLQDFCVALDNPLNGVFVNGKFCKNPADVKADDFFFSGLNKPGSFNNLGSNVTAVDVNILKGLNTLGVSLARLDVKPYGEIPPHTHPRATEIVVVLEGSLNVGFVSSNQDGNRLFTKTLNFGDVFVFPQGLIHFLFNSEKKNAVAISGLNSQNPGVITIANAVFGSNPPINPNVLGQAFQLDVNVVKDLQRKF